MCMPQWARQLGVWDLKKREFLDCIPCFTTCWVFLGKLFKFPQLCSVFNVSNYALESNVHNKALGMMPTTEEAGNKQKFPSSSSTLNTSISIAFEVPVKPNNHIFFYFVPQLIQYKFSTLESGMTTLVCHLHPAYGDFQPLSRFIHLSHLAGSLHCISSSILSSVTK